MFVAITFGEARFSMTRILTDKLFTGQRDTGMGIYHYVGITRNFPQRAAYWLNERGWRAEPIRGLSENLSRYDARAVEQALIEHYGLENLTNRINSIAATNPIYQAAVQRGNEILNTMGLFGP